jgi:hypothetical protein
MEESGASSGGRPHFGSRFFQRKADAPLPSSPLSSSPLPSAPPEPEPAAAPPAASPPPAPLRSETSTGWSLRSLVTGKSEPEPPSVVASDDERERIRRILEDLD